MKISNKKTSSHFNLFQKLEILIKKYIKNRKIYLETEEQVIDFSNLESTEKKAKTSFTINLKKIFQDKVIKSRTKPSYKYIFKTVNGQYIGGNILTISLISEVLKDIYNTNSFILENQNNAIFLLGKKYKIVKKDENFQKEIEEFFQGIEPVRVNIYDVISLLLPIDVKKIFFVIVLVIGIFVLLPLANSISQNSLSEDEELNKIPTYKPLTNIKNKKHLSKEEKIKFTKNLPKTISEIIATNYFISKLFNNPYQNLNMVFIKNIDFQNREVTYYSFMPINGFRKTNVFYTKVVKLNPSPEEVYDLFFSFKKILNKSPIKCEKIILNNGANIEYVDDNGIYKIFSLNKTLSPKKVTKFIANLYGCKAIINGNISFDYKKMTTQTDLKIKLFYQ